MTITKISAFFRSSIYLLTATLIALSSATSVSALSPHSELFIQNDILFYDPTPANDNDYGENHCIDQNHGATLSSGNTKSDLVWNFFIKNPGAGISNNPAAIAGVLGNIKQESDFDPFSVSGKSNQYYGLYQFNINEDNGFKDFLKKQGLFEYFGKKNLTGDLVAKAIDAELNFLINTKRWKEQYLGGFNYINDKTPYSYAELFVATVERAVYSREKTNSSNQIKDPGVRKYINDFIYPKNSEYQNIGYQQIDKRREYAKGFHKSLAKSNSSNKNRLSASFKDGWLINNSLNIENNDYTKSPSSYVSAKEFITSDQKPNKILLHRISPSLTTNTSHFTLDLKKRSGYQHFSINRPALAIREGNIDQQGIISIAIKVTDIKDFTPDDYKYLALIIKSVATTTGIPLSLHPDWTAKIANIIKYNDFLNYKGIIGNLHLPSISKSLDNPGNIKSVLESALKQDLTDHKILISNDNKLIDCEDASESVENIIEDIKKHGNQGLTLEQAQKFMKTYVNLRNLSATKLNQLYSIKNVRGAQGGSPIFNCVALIYYYVNGFRDGKMISPLGNGREVTTTLSKHGFPKYKKPESFAIFSTTSGETLDSNGNTYGHTGIVLGLEGNSIIIGEASYGGGPKHTTARKIDLKKFLNDNKNLSFAYFKPDQTKLANAINGTPPKK